MKTINLKEYRGGNNSTTFTGRPEGEDARIKLGLDNLDDSNEEVIVVIPTGTTSINPSFFLGLFYKSIKKFKMDNFSRKYKFEIEDNDSVIQRILRKNINEGLQYAENFINRKGGLFSFIR